ncbi:MAG: GntR family transcriptional regulator [Mesorhizobium sp.]|nr:GntR family transcriptional regulator [Mesorhizobium sp. M8A.F.Ca.ET.023.01.1.1]RVD52282.1 GntR family transcriptional regulator [Mesorhizobium sp. M8A.F.Ca.ET.023.02.2.1]RWC71846.1 MAG: GntR family transcriptional regulator [Mesorhizobium sp.]RWC71950.1 MAG: GntR family transcriptional regulator [Mesorhizobium sp.]TGV08925.1 GntR family transcriptional regulator [Mesorhizobium sp. M8A.F.Ca.ET.173.01.1.1]
MANCADCDYKRGNVRLKRLENWERNLAKETKNTLRDSVYSALKAMIVTGQIPPGSRVTESDIAAKLNVSRTPVREAFNRLERDGLVTGRPRQGYAVTEFDINMFREAFDIRELLDGHATELAATAATDKDKARLRAMLAECERLAAIPDRTTREKFQELEVGIDLHRVIAEISGNAMLHGMLCGILDKCQHYVWTELLWLDEWKIARDEHAEIVEAICAGDAVKAGALARAHVRGSRENVLRLLQAKSDYQSFLAKAS